jgi:HmuY protein
MTYPGLLLSLLTAGASLLTAGALAACAGDIRPDDFGRTADAAPSDSLTPTGPVTTAPNADGTFTTIINAVSELEWTYLDFETRAMAASTGPWDLRYQRFHISANGGVTGAGGVEVVPLPGRTLAEVTAAPTSGFITDAPDGEDPNMEPDYAFEQGEGWYAYDVQTHTLSPRPIVWVVRSTGGAVIKLAIERYYDQAGSPGWITFRWAPL